MPTKYYTQFLVMKTVNPCKSKYIMCWFGHIQLLLQFKK